MVLYDVFACPHLAVASEPNKLQRIGQIVMSSPPVSSSPHDGLLSGISEKKGWFLLMISLALCWEMLLYSRDHIIVSLRRHSGEQCGWRGQRTNTIPVSTETMS
mmetsp:Transcript_2736/g.5014  ORF Transcript_2736/g.5014 Transcript_2736/m.5014 type:complete len:104 (-) Transcript_2736:397-708(-)